MQTVNSITTELLAQIVETKQTYKLDYVPMNTLVNQIKEILPNYEFGECLETNGWEHDFWLYFTYNNIKYCVSGSWFYGAYKIGIDS